MDDGVYAAARYHRFIIDSICPRAKDRRLQSVRCGSGGSWLKIGNMKKDFY